MRLLQKYERPAIDKILENIFIRSHLINPTQIKTPSCEDLDDIMFLELAIAGSAEYLVSGDKHLLKVGKYTGGEVVTPRSFISLLS